MSISILIPAKNEGSMIAECLASAKWADEVLVLDESTDQTGQIVKSYKWVKYVFQAGGDFASRKNRLKDLATGDWLFYLDADERITPLLRREILRATKSKRALSAYAVPRRNFLLGKELHWGGWGEDYVTRLFRRAALERFEGELHEQPVFSGPLGKLSEPLIHFQPATLEEALEKSIRWSEIEARLFLEPGVNHPPVVWWRVLRMGARTLFDRLIKKQGFRDGVEGWIESVYQAYHTMIIYLRLWELQVHILEGRGLSGKRSTSET